jgi:hypothetical protein
MNKKFIIPAAAISLLKSRSAIGGVFGGRRDEPFSRLSTIDNNY